MEMDLYFIIHKTKIQLNRDLNRKGKIIKILETNMREETYTLVEEKNF